MTRSFRTRALAVLGVAVLGLTGAAPAPRPVAAESTLSVMLYCLPIGQGRFHCTTTVSGGTGPYTYAFSPTPIWGGGTWSEAIVPCLAYRNRTVSVTVTDAYGATAFDSGTFYCGDAA